MPDTDESRVAAGYDLVYEAVPRSPTLARIWREHACGPDYPAGFEHISFITLDELRTFVNDLRLTPGSRLIDLACGMGGPGLWVAREADAELTGVDVSAVAVAAASARACSLGLDVRARFQQGSFADTGIEPGSAAGVMSVDALQYAPDKRAALEEAARILAPGGRLVVACFELEPERVAGLPVLGTDPVADYAALLDAAGFDAMRYEETDRWLERLTAAYQSALDARSDLIAEMGEPAVQALAGEMSLTLQLKPYRRRVLIAATKR
ncbi:MAG TPA: class I SAM-dependent methyltransferase [Dehalococcoidia bacterium]|nr:class I SAM-dependent methyltransferase [Dehalococcoidia bacterium]